MGGAMVAGVDGCRAGWVVALAPLARRGRARLLVVASARDVLAIDADVVAIDMPIGLPDAGARACDVAARRLLGPRRSSVFPTPVRACLGAPSFRDALACHRRADGRGLSQQAFHLLPKIADIDQVITAPMQTRVVEAHPELAFVRLAGRPLPPKRTAEGVRARLACLAPELGPAPPEVRRGARLDDVLDALALTLTARRVARGRSEVLGDGALDGTGLRMEVHW